MAGAITHLVVGERVYRTLPIFGRQAQVYSAFLAGCTLVDLHTFSAIAREVTHFAPPHAGLPAPAAPEERAPEPSSCSRFLRQLAQLLTAPFARLPLSDQAFAAGYLCHLAVDEIWVRYMQRLIARFEASAAPQAAPSPAVVPGDVLLTAFDFAASRLLREASTIQDRLQEIPFSDLFTHVPSGSFERQWALVGPYLTSGGGPEAYGRLLQRAGRSGAEVLSTSLRMQRSWEDALWWVEQEGGVEPVILAAVDHSFETLPHLWQSETRLQAHHHGDGPAAA